LTCSGFYELISPTAMHHNHNRSYFLLRLNRIRHRLYQDIHSAEQSFSIMPELSKFEIARLPFSIARALHVMMTTSNNFHPTIQESQPYSEMKAALEKRIGSYQADLLSMECEFDPSWDGAIFSANKAALAIVKRHMHVEVRNMTEKELTTDPTPSGKFLPVKFAKRFKQWNILQLLRRHPKDIQRLPARTLESHRSKGLTITESQALHAHLSPLSCKWKEEASSPMTTNLEAIRKWQWYCGLRKRLRELLQEYGIHQNLHTHNSLVSCNLDSECCPVKADKLLDYYETDYGFPCHGGYEISTIPTYHINKEMAAEMPTPTKEGDEKTSEHRLSSSSSSLPITFLHTPPTGDDVIGFRKGEISVETQFWFQKFPHNLSHPTNQSLYLLSVRNQQTLKDCLASISIETVQHWWTVHFAAVVNDRLPTSPLVCIGKFVPRKRFRT
jgi:hypothetical protein